MGEAKVGDFSNGALLSEQDVPVGRLRLGHVRTNLMLGIPGGQIAVHYLVLLQELHPTADLLRGRFSSVKLDKNLSGQILTW